MDTAIRTFEEQFPRTLDYESGPEHRLLYLQPHVRNEHQGFLFDYPAENRTLFVRKDQLLNEPTETETFYKFSGFIPHSAVAVITKIAKS